MYIFDSIKSSFTAIKSHKTRSGLTLLGIMIGVASVVTMFSTVFAVKSFVKGNMEKMGWNNSVIVVPGNDDRNFNSRRRRHFRMYINRKEKPLTYNDYLYLKNKVNHLYAYSMIEYTTDFTYNGQQEYLRLKGVTNDFFKVKTYPLATGRLFSHFDEKNANKVCIIGSEFKKKHFLTENPLGKTIDINGSGYKIIGVLKPDVLATNNRNFNFNAWERYWDLKAVYLPTTTASRNTKKDNAIDFIYMQASSKQSFKPMQNGIRQHLLARHQMAHDFSFQDIGAEIAKMTGELEKMLKKWNITLSVIASISLLVGGIGLFSTLLISINERMVEIGVRKSIGATEKDIFVYFIVEAIVLALLGAFVGVSISAIVSTLVQKFAHIPFPIPATGVGLGLGFAFLIGLFSGLYPALKASKINPIQAIFYFE